MLLLHFHAKVTKLLSTEKPKKAGKMLGGIDFLYIFVPQNKGGALAHLARARHWQCRGDEFESRTLHESNRGISAMKFLCCFIQVCKPKCIP